MENTINVTQLSKSYHGSPAITDITFSVARGEIFGLLGSNGAGKSTIIECMLGTKEKDNGTVTILGMDSVTERKKLFEKVGVQFQEGNYQDKITVKELCEEIQSLYKTFTPYGTLLDQFDLSDKLKSPVSELSGGQKQRLFLVLALIPDPLVIFLDELTTGLDVEARRCVWKCLKDLNQKGLTVLLTSHFMDEVNTLCDRIGILKNGKLVFCGTVQEAIGMSPCEGLEDAYLWYNGKEESVNESF